MMVAPLNMYDKYAALHHRQIVGLKKVLMKRIYLSIDFLCIAQNRFNAARKH
jgi:hypothetical protein